MKNKNAFEQERILPQVILVTVFILSPIAIVVVKFFANEIDAFIATLLP